MVTALFLLLACGSDTGHRGDHPGHDTDATGDTETWDSEDDTGTPPLPCEVEHAAAEAKGPRTRYDRNDDLCASGLILRSDDDGPYGPLTSVAGVSRGGHAAVVFASLYDGYDGVETPGVSYLFDQQEGVVSHDAASAMLVGDSANDAAGRLVGPLGDTQGDGSNSLFVASAREVWILSTPAGDGTVPLGTRSFATMDEHVIDQALAGPGDVDGDGHADIISSAYYYSADPESLTDDGGAWLFRGPFQGAMTRDDASTVWLGARRQFFGVTTKAVGDLTGDGLPDVAISSLYLTANQEQDNECGVVYIDSDPASGVLAPQDADVALAGTTNYGTWVAGQDFAGGNDVDGDGYTDLLVAGGPLRPMYTPEVDEVVWLLRGPFTADRSLHDDADASFSVNESASCHSGCGVANPGDMDGDGHGEVVIGWDAACTDTRGCTGAVTIFYGPVWGAHDWDEADAILAGVGIGWDYPGGPGLLAPAGDYDGDGLADLVIGSGFGDEEHRTPVGYVLFGRPP